MPDTCKDVTGEWIISESLLDLNQGVKKYLILQFFDPSEPQSTAIITKIKKEMQIYVMCVVAQAYSCSDLYYSFKWSDMPKWQKKLAPNSLL